MQDPSAPESLRLRAGARAAGSLSVLPPFALLQAAQASPLDVRLVMREHRSGSVLVVSYRKGRPGMVFSPGDGRSLGELLLAAGAIDRTTLVELFETRTRHHSGSLERLLREQAGIEGKRLQAFFDFQARVRLLEALVWEDGSFELEQTDEPAFPSSRVELPNLAALAIRAQARAATHRRLAGAVPARLDNLMLRRRRGAAVPASGLGRAVWDELTGPLLFTQVVARLLVDDDLILEKVVELAEERSILLQPRVALADPSPAPAGVSPLHAELLQRVLEERATGAAPNRDVLWVALVAADPDEAVAMARRLGGNGHADPPAGLPVAFASTTARITRRLRLVLLVVRPGALSEAALAGVMARCDAICLLRKGDGDGELGRVCEQSAELARRTARRPLTLGVDLGARLRAWGAAADAIVGLPGWSGESAPWLLERLIEGLFAASSATATD